LQAQNSFGSEEELKAQAAKLFDADEFEEAYPLYSQLLSLYPKDPTYNFRLGVCMLYASDDKEKAIPFLEYAAKRPDVEKEVIYYMARAYHLNYRFDEAITQFNAYKKVASEAKAEKLLVDRQIEMCKNGKKLLRNLTDLVVIDKKEMSRTDFFRSYDISDIGGKLLVKPDEEAFKSSVDKKRKEKSIIYLSSTNSQVYFSSYGDDPERGKDIYIIRKLPNGEWSKAQTLGYPVNTEYDEDYPFLHPNGKVLYFCSKGHNSMGGYDIFKTTLNEETNTWNKPVNMDFPINTPDDDILYVTNGDEKEAFFSSARASATGKTAVYHINVERKPIDIAIIKGAVVRNRENQAIDVKITVKDLGDNSILGIYNSKAENGVYLINLPNGGKFMYTVEATGFATQSEVVDLPTQYVFKPLKQEISYELGTDKLIVKNMFDEPVDEASYMLALNFIKERSKMDVGSNPETTAASTNASENSTKQEGNSEQATTNSTKSNPQNTGASLSNADIVNIAFNDAKEAAKEAIDLQEQADIALNLANTKKELAQNKTQEAAQLQADANKMSDPEKKQATLNEANDAFVEADVLNQETVAAFNIAKRLQVKAIAKDEEAVLAKQYATDLEAAIKSKNPEAALAKLDEQEKKLEELSKKNGNAEPDDIFSGLKLDEANKKRELDKATNLKEDLKQEIADNETLIASLYSDAEKTKKEDLKKGLLDQIEGLKEENIEKKKELELADIKVAQVQKEYNGIKNEMALVNNVVDKSQTGTSEQASASVAAIDKNKLEQEVNEIKKSESLAANTTSAANAGNTNTAGSNNTNTTASNNSSSTSNSTENVSTTDVATSNAAAVPTKAELEKDYGSRLSTLEDLTDPVEKESKKAELYSAWTNAASDAIAAKKTALKTEKDKAKKKELSAEISELEKELASKKKLAATTLASAEKLKKEQQALAASGNNSGNNNAGTENNNVENASSSERPANINRTYEEKIAAADQISDEKERNVAKADALREWSKAIDADVEKKKAELASSTDPEMKALLAKKISDAEALSKEKNKAADELAGSLASNATNNASSTNTNTSENSTASNNSGNTNSGNNTTANNTTATNDAAAVNNTGTVNNASNSTNSINPDNNSDPISLSSQKLSSAIAESNTAPGTELEKESRKAEAYKEYISVRTATIEQKKTEMRAVTDPGKKADLATEIVSLQSDLSDKQNMLDAVNDKVEALRKTEGNIAANNATSSENNSTTANENNQPENTAGNNSNSGNIANSTANNSTTSGNNPDNVNAVDPGSTNTSENNSGSSANNTAAGNKSNVPVFNDNVASEKAAAAALVLKESEALETQANELKAKAAETSKQSEKDQLINEADALLAKSEIRKAEADQAFVEANTIEFNSNKNVLDQMAAAAAGNSSDEVSMAEMMKDESLIYFEKAKKSQELAAETTNAFDKEVAIEDALNNQKIALAKQNSAAELYKKNNPTFVASNNTSSAATNNTAGNAANNTANNTNAANNTVNNAANNTNASNNTTNNTENNTLANNTENKNANAGNNSAVNNNTNTAANTEANTETNINNTNAANNTTTAANNNNTPEVNAGNASTNTAENTNNSGTNTGSTDPSANTGNTNNTTNNAAAGTNTSLAVLEPTDRFERTTQAVYTAARPIPVNEKLPEGLVFKVQIGAFRNPIAPEIFKGMSPITAETTPTGLTRYTAGLFTKFATADKVKEEIRALGYRDAFVVAFLNGKRISMNEAQALAGGTIPVVNNNAGTNTGSADNNSAANNAANNNAANNTSTAGTQQPQNTDLAPTTNVSTVSGLFYTVQVGVYSQPVTSAKLRNCQPLYSERTASGALRYTTGIYNNIARAVEAKDRAVSAGISDAFVSAYLNGKRISMPEAEKLQQSGNVVFPSTPDMNALPTFTAGAAAPQNRPVVNQPNPEPSAQPNPENNTPVNNTPVNNSAVDNRPEAITPAPALNEAIASQSSVPDTGLVYQVQIGAFKDEVPLEIANRYLKIAKKGIRSRKDQNGLTIYSVGAYRTYEEANVARAEVVADSGVTDAFIVAYNDGKKITLEEAKVLQNK
jgi:hypothetical protein